MTNITWGTFSTALAAPLILILPGWALLELLLPRQRLPNKPRPDLLTWLILATGVTLSSIPLAFLWLHKVGLRVSPWTVRAILLFSVVFICWRYRETWGRTWCWLTSWHLRSGRLDISYLVLALVTALIVWLRLWVVRGINVGFWADSYHHTMITQLILDNHGLFDSWEPYARLRSLVYHFGFHAYTAFFYWATHWLTNTPTPRTVVLVAQFLNALAVLALFPLAVRLSGGRRWVGIVTVLIAGLLTPMPMFYVNWGRYTQLAGQVILPIALWFTMETMEGQRMNVRCMALVVLTVSGLVLTHYLVFAFYLGFMVPYLGWWLFGRLRRREPYRHALLALLLIAVVTTLVSLPQTIKLKGYLPGALHGFVKGSHAQEFMQKLTMWRPLPQFVPLYLAGIGLLGGLWALLRREKIAVMLIGTGCLFLMSNPHWLGLPGRGVINNFTVQISLYIPLGILAAYFIVIFLEWGWKSLKRMKILVGLMVGILFVLAAAIGIRQQQNIIDPERRFFNSADQEAFEWVRHNTPQDARFLINFYFSRGGTLVVGRDSGFWLPLLTGRTTIVPPMPYGTESGPNPWYLWQVNNMAHRIQESGPANSDTVEYLIEQGITHVYIGIRNDLLLTPDEFRASPHFRTIYPPDGKNSGPWIFEIISP